MASLNVHAPTPYHFVDTAEGIISLLTNIIGLPTSQPSLYLDLEGDNLSRFGTVSILQILLAPLSQVYLIDVHTLRGVAFTTPDPSSGITLRAILEDSNIPKVFFDVRNDSDALHAHYGIRLRGVQDLQLMELTRRRGARLLNGLGKCIQCDLPLTAGDKVAWLRTKENGRRLYDPKLGGSYAVFDQRPLSEDLKMYCIQDVTLLAPLWRAYNARMSSQDRSKVLSWSQKRVLESQAPGYRGTGKRMALAPEW